MMCVNASVIENLCTLYPRTAEILRDMALLKREIILHYMEVNLTLRHEHAQTGGVPNGFISDDGQETPKNAL